MILRLLIFSRLGAASFSSGTAFSAPLPGVVRFLGHYVHRLEVDVIVPGRRGGFGRDVAAQAFRLSFSRRLLGSRRNSGPRFCSGHSGEVMVSGCLGPAV